MTSCQKLGAMDARHVAMSPSADSGKDDVFVEGLMRNVVDNIPAATQALLDRGLAMPVSDARPSTYPGHFGAVWFLRDPVTGEQSMKPDKDGRAYYVNAGGPYLSQSLLSAVQDAGVDLRCDTMPPAWKWRATPSWECR